MAKMKNQDKFLLVMLLGVGAFELGPPLWAKFEEEVLNQKPPPPPPVAEILQHARQDKLAYEIKSP